MARQPDSGIVENFLRRDGRLNRWRYFKRVLALGLVNTLIFFAVIFVCGDLAGNISASGNIVMKVIGILSQLPFYFLMVRRLQDIGRDEKLAQISVAIGIASTIFTDYGINAAEPSPVEMVILLIDSAIGLYLLFCPGTRGTNQYGEDPLE